MATLTIHLPGLPPVSHVLNDETITVGRMKGNTIVIEDNSISLMHAKITRKDGQFFLKDLNSTNGTVVNGQPITEVKLRDLDKVRFAEVSGQFSSDSASLVTNSPPAPVLDAPKIINATRPASPPAITTPSAHASAAPAAISAPERPKERPSQTRKHTRKLASFLPYSGAGVALAVVAFLGWRFLHLDRAEAIPAAALEANRSPIQLNKKQEAKSAVGLSPRAPNSLNAGDLAKAHEQVSDSLSQLATALKAADPMERRRAAQTLHAMGPDAKPVFADIRAALLDSDPDVQMWAALSLVNNQDYNKAAIPILVRVLRNDNPVLRQVACLSLGLIPYAEAEKDTVVPALAEIAGQDAEEEVRKAAISALGIIAPELIGQVGTK